MNKPLFGPAGPGDKMKADGLKSNLDAPRMLAELGLTAYEYQCGHGVNVSDEGARAFGEECRKFGIRPSLHAPYFISLSSVSEETRLKSVEHILKSAAAAKAMGADRIVVHSGSCSKMTREEALALVSDTLKQAYAAMREAGTDSVHLCPETMGKMNQLGDLNEVLSLCGLEESFIPCIDFGHLNCRTHGGLKTRADFAALLDTVEDRLGKDRAALLHIHFSRIEYGDGGEKKHLTFEDTQYGPFFEPLAEELLARDYMPTVICESAGTQEIDAKQMSDQYEKMIKERI